MLEKNKKLENGGGMENIQTKSTLDVDSFEKIEEKKRDNYFTDLQEVVFYKNKNNKLMGRLPSGKYVLLHKSEDPNSVTEGFPYICILKHLEKVSFAKVISPVFLPRVIVRKKKIISAAHKGKENKILEKREIIFVHKNKENKIVREKLEDVDILLERIYKLEIEKFICILRKEEQEENPYSVKKL